MPRVYALYDNDTGKWYAGSRRGMPVWSDVPKTFSSLNSLRLSLQQTKNYITGRMSIKTCALDIVDSRYVNAADVTKRSSR